MTFAHSANSAYLFGKCRYNAAALMPTLAAISSIDAAVLRCTKIVASARVRRA
jgi:hypothetical protein